MRTWYCSTNLMLHRFHLCFFRNLNNSCLSLTSCTSSASWLVSFFTCNRRSSQWYKITYSDLWPCISPNWEFVWPFPPTTCSLAASSGSHVWLFLPSNLGNWGKQPLPGMCLHLSSAILPAGRHLVQRWWVLYDKRYKHEPILIHDLRAALIF